MIIHKRNREATYSACPVLADADVEAFLTDGTLPIDPSFFEAPPWIVVRNRGFWLKMSYKAHVDATLLLISTDPYVMNVDPLEGMRSKIFCYYSDNSCTHYLGRINEQDAHNGAERALLPLIDGIHDPLPLSVLTYRGRVVAAC